MHLNDASADASGGVRKPTGELKAPTGSLKRASIVAADPVVDAPHSRDFSVRLGELIILMAAIVGSVALGLGISDYLGSHRYVTGYLIAYAGFRLADLLVRDDAALGMDRARFGRRVMFELPLLAVFFAAPFERTYIYGGETYRWLGGLGLLIELIGLWLALGARIQIGFFSSHPENRDREFVRSGLYHYIRHPIYTGEYLVILAWPLIYGAPITLTLTAVIGAFFMRRRVRDEEADMLARFGDEYADYMRRTDNMIPNVW